MFRSQTWHQFPWAVYGLLSGPLIDTNVLWLLKRSIFLWPLCLWYKTQICPAGKQEIKRSLSDLFDDGGDRGHLTRGTYTASVACFLVLLICFCRVLFVEKDRRLLIRWCFFFQVHIDICWQWWRMQWSRRVGITKWVHCTKQTYRQNSRTKAALRCVLCKPNVIASLRHCCRCVIYPGHLSQVSTGSCTGKVGGTGSREVWLLIGKMARGICANNVISARSHCRLFSFAVCVIS